MDNTQIYVPFAKKDEEKRLVYGYASTEALDSQEEIVEKNAIMEALPDYMKFGNIREMHQPVAVGKTHQANVDDKGLFIKVKIVDDQAWAKVKEGVYNGFSIGGRVVTKIGNKIKNLVLSEISIVDRPANPEALFSVVKFDQAGKVAKEYNELEEINLEEDQAAMEEANRKAEELTSFIERQVSIMETSQIISIARELVYMISECIWEGEEYADLEEAVNSLKRAAIVTLGEEQAEAMTEKMNDIIEMVKVQKNNPDSYAYVNKAGERFLPVANVDLIKASVENFNRVNFESEDHRILAARIIKSAADSVELKINTSITNLAAQPMKIEIAKEYTPVYHLRETNYFDIMKYAIG